jgi:hypothetical protein
LVPFVSVFNQQQHVAYRDRTGTIGENGEVGAATGLRRSSAAEIRRGIRIRSDQIVL